MDAELPSPEMEAFRAHLATCPDCAAATLALTESKMAIRRAGNRYAAPPELRAKVFRLAKANRSGTMRSAAIERVGILRRDIGLVGHSPLLRFCYSRPDCSLQRIAGRVRRRLPSLPICM